jgi:hypothetical protein
MVILWWSYGEWNYMELCIILIIPASGVIKHSLNILHLLRWFPTFKPAQKKSGISQAAFDYWRVFHGISTSWNYELTEHESHLFINGWYVIALNSVWHGQCLHFASWSQSLKTWGMSSDRRCPKQPSGEGPRARFQTTLNSVAWCHIMAYITYIIWPTMWCPPVISWFINSINYSYIYHKP